MKWSKNQQFAIDTLDKNILVAAGAGSGKTAVLVERIKNIVIDSSPKGANVDEILVLTFTKAAATEMKSRLVMTIKNMISKNEGNISHLKEQLENINKAQISTFHSFAQSIIKENYFELGISPKMKVIDEIQSNILKYKAIDQTFEFLFSEENNENFKNFLKSYSSAKNEKNIKDEILQLYSQIMSIPNPFEFLEENFDKQGKILDNSAFQKEVDEFRKKLKGWGDKIICKYIIWLKNEKILLRDVLEDAGCIKMARKQDVDIENITVIEKMANTGDGADGKVLFDRIRNLKFTQLRATKDEKELFDDVKSSLENIKENIKKYREKLKIVENVNSYEDIFKEISNTKDNGKTLFTILKIFHNEYQRIKLSKNVIDFSDIEHMAIEILKNNKIAQEYKRKYKYIFIDEYQDTNSVQEYIINAVKRENNLFMVGDIKQSIYRFRMADPDIFKEKYANFTDWQEPAKNSIKVDLNGNFRSKKEILYGVNEVFSNSMENYDDKAKLDPGITEDLGFESLKQFNEEEVIKSGIDIYLPYKVKKNKKNEEEYESFIENFYKYIDEIGIRKIDEEIDIKRLKNEQIEAMTIVDIIKKTIGKKYFDVKKNEIRTVSYKDIVILMRSMTKSQEIKYILEKNNIPVYVQNDKGYFDNLEIKLILDLLKTIGNKNQDLPLLGALASPAFGFDEKELGEIRLINKSVKFHKAFMEYAQNGTEEKIKDKCQKAVDKLKKWKQDSMKTDLEEFLWNVMIESNIYQTVGTWTNGSQRQLNLRTLIDRAAYFKSIGESSLKPFLGYVDNIKDKGIQVGESSNTSEADDIVRIMTIHKSKGLEYPVVIVAGVSSKFNLKSSTSNFIFNKNIGLFLKDVDLKEKTKKKTVIQKIINDIEREKNIEEEIRVLYVAMTRAKEQLIIIGTRETEDYINNVREYSTYKEVLMEAVQSFSESSNIRLWDKYDYTEYGKYIPRSTEKGSDEENWKSFIKNSLENADSNLINKIDEIMTFKYAYETDAKTKSKVTVSQLNENKYLQYLKEESVYDKKSEITKANHYDADGELFLNSINDKYESDERENELERDKRILSASERGNMYHRIMEEIDFDTAKKDYEKEIDKVIESLIHRGVYQKEKINHVNKSEILKFFESKIGKRAIDSSCQKEIGFKMKYTMDGGETILQGIIDCLFEEDGEFVIIDYKTNSSSKNIKEKYERQMELYKMAVEQATEKKVKECWLYLFKTGEEVRVF